MKVVKTVDEVRGYIKKWQTEGLTIGLVPTMGYLHEGHLSLIEKAKENDKVIVSIFVNPTQFGPNEDLDKYPRDLERDIKMCDEKGVDLVFNPQPLEMYPQGFCSFVDMTVLTEELCGKNRPNHFRGVCTVVSKLFNIITPDKAYFGEKDAQQLAVIKQMVRDLNFNIEVVGCPIVRESDGLAMSSRNTNLNAEERQAALVLIKSMEIGKAMLDEGEKRVSAVIDAMKACVLEEPMAKIDYIEAVDRSTLKKIDHIEGDVLVAMAVFIGSTRLIDNFLFKA